jgi:hypothetical protein
MGWRWIIHALVTFALKEAITHFNLDDISEQARCACSELQNTDEFQAADSFRRRIFLSVDYLRSDGLTIPFSEIGMIFGASKATVLKHDQRELNERQKVGRPLCVEAGTWQQRKTMIRERFENHCPITTDDALDFLGMHFGLHLLPNTLRRKVSLDHELMMITGVPLEKERLACAPEEIAAYFELLDRNVAGIPAAHKCSSDIVKTDSFLWEGSSRNSEWSTDGVKAFFCPENGRRQVFPATVG